jgi:glycosyltransferase involved in cell wall biosynthesis
MTFFLFNSYFPGLFWWGLGLRTGGAANKRVLLAVGAAALQPPFRWLMRGARWFRARKNQMRGAGRAGGLLDGLARPGAFLRRELGFEDHGYPAGRHLLSLTPRPPALVHCHNLHGGYFDIRALPEISRRAPVILGMHDAWLLAGHCCHAFGCEKWETGCGGCPGLDIPYRLKRDRTARNWRLKRDVYSRSVLYVLTPCEWLLAKARRSMLRPAASRAIPYGLDIDRFALGDKVRAREALGIPKDAFVLLFSGIGLVKNIWKDFPTFVSAMELLAGRALPKTILALCLGQNHSPLEMGGVRVEFAGHVGEKEVILHNQAADLYVHLARADTFPNTVLEALACGLPVIGTAVGGIPEQIVHGKTGWLVPEKDPGAVADSILALLNDPEKLRDFSRAAREDAVERFSLSRFIQANVDWYGEILRDHAERTGAPLEARRGF